MTTKRLTDSAIKRFPTPATGRITHWDATQPGLGLCISNKGRKTWIVMTRLAGKQIKLTLGTYPAISLQEARKQAAAKILAAKRGDDPRHLELRASLRVPRTVDSLLAEHIETHVRRNMKGVPGAASASSSSAYAREGYLRRHVLDRWSGRPIDTIAKSEVYAMLDECMATGKGGNANSAHSAAKVFFIWCVERGYLAESPCDGIKKPRRFASRDHVLTDEELVAVWKACDEVGYPWGPFARMLILTGQRRMEVGAMPRSETNLDDALWVIEAERTKPGRRHEVPLSSAAVETLRAVPEKSEFYFVSTALINPTRPFTTYSFAKDTLQEASGTDGWTFHDIRRSVATGMARLHIDEGVITRVLNHSVQRWAGVTSIYNRHDYQAEKCAALDAWSNHIEHLLRPDDGVVVPLRA